MAKSDFNQLAAIVDDFIIENDLHNGWFPKALLWAKRGLRELNLDIHQEPITEMLPVTDRKTVVLPDGFVDWVAVAMRQGQYFITLGVNGKLNGLERSVGDQTVPGLLSQNLPNGLDFSAYSGYNFFNFGGGSFFSIGGGLPSKGYFRVVDHGACKELLMDYDFPCKEVYLEYITDGLKTCGTTLVSAYHYDYLIKYMELKYEEHNNPKANESSIFRKGQEVHFAEKRIRARNNSIDPQTLLNITRQEARLTPHL